MTARCLRVANVFLFLFEHVLRRHLAANPFTVGGGVYRVVDIDHLGSSGLATGEGLRGVGMSWNREDLGRRVKYWLAGGISSEQPQG